MKKDKYVLVWIPNETPADSTDGMKQKTFYSAKYAQRERDKLREQGFKRVVVKVVAIEKRK